MEGTLVKLLLSRVIGRRRLLSFLAALFIGLYSANLAFALIVESGIGLDQILKGGGGRGVVVLDQGSRSIYTSRIPLSLALSLSKLPSVEVEPLVLSICYVRGVTIVMRGVDSTVDYASHLVAGSLPGSDGAWVVFGRRAADRVGAVVGRAIPVASSLGRTVLLLTVAGVCDFGDMRDDEALVHREIGRELSNIPRGMISAAIVRGLDREKVDALVRRNYRLGVNCVSDMPGSLVVLDANGLLMRTSEVTNSFEENFELPFGYYTIVFRSPHLYSVLGAVLLNSDQTLKYAVRIESHPVLRVSTQTKPVLRRSDGVEVDGSFQEGSWIFTSIPGIHTLQVNSNTYVLPLFRTATFDPAISGGKPYTTRISVMWSDGTAASDYNLLIRTTEGKIVLAMLAAGKQVEVDLPEGEYMIEAFKLPYSTQVAISAPADSEITLILPSIGSNVEKIPIKYYTFIRSMPVETLSSFTLASISGISAALLVGLAISIIFLFAAALTTVQRYLYLSAKSRLNVLALLGASRSFYLKSIELPILFMSLASGLAATFISLISSDWLFSELTILGHSIPRNTTSILVFSTALAILVWSWGHFVLIRTVEAK